MMVSNVGSVSHRTQSRKPRNLSAHLPFCSQSSFHPRTAIVKLEWPGTQLEKPRSDPGASRTSLRGQTSRESLPHSAAKGCLSRNAPQPHLQCLRETPNDTHHPAIPRRTGFLAPPRWPRLISGLGPPQLGKLTGITTNVGTRTTTRTRTADSPRTWSSTAS